MKIRLVLKGYQATEIGLYCIQKNIILKWEN